jgi:signal transduction histidine kinase
MATHRPNTWAPPAWPVLVAFGLVTLLITGMLGIDLMLGHRVASQTSDMIDNSQRSTDLLEDMRAHIRGLVAADLDERAIEPLTRAIERDARAYDPLATDEGEGEEWTHLQVLLQRLSASPVKSPRTRVDLGEEISRSIDRLIAINGIAARSSAVSIRSAHRDALWGDMVVGGGTLALVTVIAVTLLRVLARQRRLIAERVRLLDEKNSELEAFAGRAAHDLRSPMNPIRGYADLIIEGKESPEEIAMMAQRIRRAVDRMARVVDDILALSTSGRPLPGQTPTAPVVAAVIEEMGPDLHEAELVTKLAGGRIACQEGILGQILRNLIGNAIKFRARSRPLKITLEIRDVGSMVEITVEDNGVGMDPESAQHAFEPFYRGQMDREVPGHGLGLAIVERTTRALGGTSELSSVLDQGTRIVIRLPRA